MFCIDTVRTSDFRARFGLVYGATAHLARVQDGRWRWYDIASRRTPSTIPRPSNQTAMTPAETVRQTIELEHAKSALSNSCTRARISNLRWRYWGIPL